MKFLVLALCVCAASAASVGYKPWQPVQQGSRAYAQASVSAPEAVYKTIEPAFKAVAAPVAAVVNAPIAVAKAVAYNTPVAVTKNAVYGDEANSAIVRFDSDVNAEGFNYAFETQNGIAAESSGTLKKVDNTEVLAVQGSYQYITPDGTHVQFSYIADENGYQPRSDLLPVGPPIPEAILRSLEYIRAHPQKPENY